MLTLFFIIGVTITFFIALNWLGKPTCAYCHEKIHEEIYSAIGSPSNYTLHNKCVDGMYKRMEEDPTHQRKTREYIEMLDRQRTDNPPSKEEWQEFWCRYR